MTCKISIIVALYNGGSFFNDTIKSILDQSFYDFEVIIINDCSTDNSEKIVLPYLEDTRFIYLKNKINLNIVKTRNKGLKIAKGKYICFLDQDDIILPTKLEKQIAFLEENSEYGMVGCGVEIIDQKGKIIGKQLPRTTDQEIRNHILLSNQFACGAVMFRKSLISQIGFLDDKFRKCDDYDYRLKIGKVSKFSNLSETLFQYRIHDSNTTKQGSNQLDMKLKTLLLIIQRGNTYPNYIISIIISIIHIIIPEQVFSYFVGLYNKGRNK